MGAASSRNQVSNENESQSLGYRYPPEDGENYFANHYYLGHRKFETGEPELFLFGELGDLNFLPPQPTTFPYKQPGKSQPVACLRSFVNLQRETVRLTRVSAGSDHYNIEFMFDADVGCSFTILQDLPDNTPIPRSKEANWEVPSSPVFHYTAGSGQSFNQASYTINPSKYSPEALTYDPEDGQGTFPLVIMMQTETGDQCQMTLCTLEAVNNSSGFVAKVLKQKLLADGVEYLLQEVYGLENKAREDEDNESNASDLDEDLGAECVICITEPKDTILLPCRHLCLCSSCAGNLRYQSSNCPICRTPFRAVLQIQALEPLDPDLVLDDDEISSNPKYSTAPGYQCVPLLQALNGYCLEEAEEVETGPTPTQVSDGEEQQEPSSPPPQQQRSDELVCVIPIEDEVLETDSISPDPANPPTRRAMASKPPKSPRAMDSSTDLPGTAQSEHVTLSLDEGQSHCGSSISSEISVKSSDMLLPITNP